MKKKPLVSVIIVNWNGWLYLKDCLASLRKITYPRYEIIVVDNGSTDGSVEEMQNSHLFGGRAKLKTIFNKKNLGFAEANNQGIKIAQGKYILFLNNDTKVEPDFLSKLVEELENHPQVVAVQSKILLMKPPGTLDSIGSFFTKTGFLVHYGYREKDKKSLSKKMKIFSAMGVCLLFRKAVLERIGFFDPDFFAYFEETDLCWRAWLSGGKIVYVPEAVIYHYKGATSSRMANAFITYHSFKNRICSLIKNLEMKNLVWLLPTHLFLCGLIALAYLFQRRPENSRAILQAFGWNLFSLKKTLKKRKKVQKKIRKVSDRDLWPQISRKISWRHYWQLWRRSGGVV